MPNFGMAEQFGIPVDDLSERAWNLRNTRNCPFRGAECNKKGGVCSLTDGHSYPIVCPERFKEDDLLYRTVCEIAFGSTDGCVAVGEVPFLRSVSGENTSPGKIDNIIAKVEDGEIADWCALEIQAVYFSGQGMAKEIRRYEENRTVQEAGSRRPDFRSSGTKRLMPQLQIKVPTLRRWGKKMFVAIDEPFVEWLPEMKTANDISNADICWLGFGLDRSQNPYRLRVVHQILATLEESTISLVAGEAPPMDEFSHAVKDKIARATIWPRQS